MADEEPKPKRSRAAKSMQAIDGDDEFSDSSIKPGSLVRPLKLKPTLDAMPLPKNVAEPTRENNLFIRLFAKIFR